MDSKLINQPNDRTSVHDDEIDLFELWNGLVEEKLTILVSLVSVLIIAALYAFSVKPVYQAESYLLPPSLEKVLPMNELAIVLYDNANANANTPQSVFDQFQTILGSRQALRAVFDKYQLINLYKPGIAELTGVDKVKAEREAFASFMKSFSLKRPGAKDASKSLVVSLALTLTEEEVADILNDLIKMAEMETVQKLYQQIISEKNSRLGLLKDQVLSVKQVATDKRLDRIAQLEEAIAIGQQLGLKKPVLERDYNNSLYLLGSDLLNAEKTVLESRKNDDAFIPELRDLEKQLQKLENLKVVQADFGVMTIDQAAVYADKIKPKKSLILAVAGVLGLMLGVFIALIRRAVKNRRQADEVTV